MNNFRIKLCCFLISLSITLIMPEECSGNIAVMNLVKIGRIKTDSEIPSWLQILGMVIGITLGFCITLGFMFLAFGGYLYET